MSPGRWLVLLGVSFGSSGCCSDDAERPPWERSDGAVAATDGQVATTDGAVDSGPAFAAVDGQVDLEGSRATVEVGGQRLSPGGIVRAWLEADLDADGDADAALVQESPPEEGRTERAVQLVTFRRDQDRFVETGRETLGALAGGCAPTAIALRYAAVGTVALRVATSCPSAPDPDGGVAVAGPRASAIAAVATGPFPLRPHVVARLDGDAATLTMDVADRDGDGTSDAVLGLARAGARAEVVWLERSGGPSIDPAATERSLAAAIPPPAGRKRLQANLPLLQGLVDLRRLLCTGALDASTLTLGDRPARECRTSRAIGNAISFLVRGHVDAGRIPQARAALGLLQMEGVGLGEERRVALERMIAERTTLAVEATHETGPVAVVTPPRPGDRMPVRFLDDDRVWVESSPPFIYYLSSRTAQPVDPLPPPSREGTPSSSPPPALPEARSGAYRAVGVAEGLYVADGDAWALVPSSRIGGGWIDAVSLAISPSGDAVAAARAGRLQIVRLRRAAAPVPIVGGDGGVRGGDGGGASERPTGEPGPSGP